MENDKLRLSINAKTIILILLLLNFGYAYKKISQYSNIKKTGYIREKRIQDQIKLRIMKSFGSVEEMDSLIADFSKQKEDAAILQKTLKAQDNQISKLYMELNDIKTNHEEEKTFLRQKILDIANMLSKCKNSYEQLNDANAELKNAKSKIEIGNPHLQKKLMNLEELVPDFQNQ